MFSTRQHPGIERAARDAETLHRFRIMPAHHGVMLWLYRDGWRILQPFSSREVAEDFLFARLARIEPTRGDINRPQPPPAVIWSGF